MFFSNPENEQVKISLFFPVIHKKFKKSNPVKNNFDLSTHSAIIGRVFECKWIAIKTH